MRYFSTRETSIYFTVSTSSLDILASYKYQGDYYDDKPTYYKKGKDPHNDIICVVKSEQPYELYFILRDTWNTNLSNIVRKHHFNSWF